MSGVPEKRLTAAEWRALVEFLQPLRRRMQELHEELRPAADALGDHHAELRDEIRSVVLPSITDDIEELKHGIRRAELLAEFSARRAGETQNTVGWHS